MLIMQLKTSSEIRVPHAEVARYATYTEGNLANIELASSAATRGGSTPGSSREFAPGNPRQQLQ